MITRTILRLGSFDSPLSISFSFSRVDSTMPPRSDSLRSNNSCTMTSRASRSNRATTMPCAIAGS